MSQKKTNNEIITERLKGLFAYNDLMFAYYCGSKAYGTTDKNSDVDIVAVFNDLNGITHAAFEDIDIFAYSIESFIQRQSISDELPLYNLIHADDFVKAKENIIYLNPEYKNDFNKLTAIGFEKVLPDYLDAFLEYYDLLINKQKVKVKRAYHIYRVKAIIDNFKKSKKYDVDIPKAVVDKITNYKKNWASLEDDVIVEFSKLLDEIKEFRESLKVGDQSEV